MNCPVEQIIEEPIKQSINPYVIVGIFILIVISAILIYEIWALHNKKPTVSKWFQHFSGRFNWFKWLLGGSLIALAIHWMFGF